MDKEQLIEKYLHSELTETEVVALNRLLETDEKFKDEFEMRTILYADYKTSIKKELIQSIPESKHIQKGQSDRTDNASSKWFRLILAASLVILVTYLALNYFNSTATTDTLIAQQLEDSSKYPTITKEDKIDTANLWSVAKQQYISHQFDEFLQNISSLELNSEQQYYVGLAHGLKSTPDFPEAIKNLKNIASQANSSFQEEARWYLALFYLKNGENIESEVLLKRIISEQSWKHAEAQKIVDSLED